MSSASLFLQWVLGTVRVFVRTAAQDWDLGGRAGTGAVSPSSHSAWHLDGRTHCGPRHPSCAHADPRQDSHARPCCRTEQVGRLQHSLRVLTGLHAQGGHAGCAVALTTVGWQEGQAHGVRNTAGAQTITCKNDKSGTRGENQIFITTSSLSPSLFAN